MVGRIDVERMLDEMSAAEFARWEAFYRREPWGFEVENHRAGVLAATVANVSGKSIKTPVNPVDFFPKPQKPRDLRAEVHAIFGPMVKGD